MTDQVARTYDLCTWCDGQGERGDWRCQHCDGTGMVEWGDPYSEDDYEDFDQ